jgi:glycerol uptake facilitator-like aquaporin
MGGPVYTELPGLFNLMKDCVEEFIGTFMLITFIFILNNENTTFIYD